MKPLSADTDITIDDPDGTVRSRAGGRVLDPDRRRPGRVFVGAVAAAGGALLLALAVPRLFSAIELMDATGIARRAQVNDARLSDVQIESAAVALQHALSWQDDADLSALLAASRLAQAKRVDTQERAAPKLAQTIDAAKRAIRLSPAHATAWTLLALALEASDSRDPMFPMALERAIAVAPFDPRYMDQRVEMACRHWHRIDAATRKLAMAQIRIVAGRDLRTLAHITQRSFGLMQVREALAGDPELLDKFDAVYMTLE